MKLLDVLVNELPARGGWPGKSVHAWCDTDGEVRFRSGGCEPDFYPKVAVDKEDRVPRMIFHEDDPAYIVTKAQYDKALAEK